MTPNRPIAVSVAGLDPSGGAGIAADLRTFEALGAHGACVIAALTVQDSARVYAVRPIPARHVAEALAAVVADSKPAAIKTGMLATDSVVDAVVSVLGAGPIPFLVVDPVRRSTSGTVLLDDDGWRALGERLVPLAALVTPNRAEAEELAAMAISTEDDAVRAARRIAERGCKAVLVKGGHGPGAEATDLLFDATTGRVDRFEAPRVPGDFHGTGCVLSAAITALLARGLSLADAVGSAKEHLSRALATAEMVGRGRRILRIQPGATD